MTSLNIFFISTNDLKAKKLVCMRNLFSVKLHRMSLSNRILDVLGILDFTAGVRKFGTCSYTETGHNK